ncbi:MAG TPA: hypothetical protein VEA63_06620 [Opitutus sp.]|nr:hypothetical protein [Opitutus sp.]
MTSKKNTVSVEDLLRLKRAERPRPEFWAEFERELRVKQLAAIVEPRPWWSPFIRVSARVARLQLPMGAAAVLAISFVTVREYREPDAESLRLPEIAAPAVYSEAMTRVAITPSGSDLATRAPAEAQLAEATSAESQPTDAMAAMEVGQAAHVVALLDNNTSLHREPTPSARYIAANLAAAQADNPGLMDDVFGAATSSRAKLREPVRDPLAQMAVPGESRRSRLLATALPAVVGAADMEITGGDRMSRRLTEDRLYDSISRIGVKGDRVAFKF